MEKKKKKKRHYLENFEESIQYCVLKYYTSAALIYKTIILGVRLGWQVAVTHTEKVA